MEVLPPQNIEAEESLLSAIILDNSALLEVLEILKSEDFYRPSHQEVYKAITELFKKNEPIDIITVNNILKEKKILEEIGGSTFLANLIDTVPMAINTEYYARIVKNKSILRKLIGKANEISKKCFTAQGDVDEVLQFAEKAIFDISGHKIQRAFYQLGEIIIDNIDTLEERQGNNTLITGVPTGFTRLDYLTAGLQGSDLIILAARPSMGKTALGLNIARNAAVEGGVPVAFFSLEMSKEQLSLRLLCAEAHVDSSRLRGGFFSNDDFLSITNAAEALSEAPIYIDDSPGISAIDIRTKARRLKMEKGLGLIIIDYLQLMKSSTSKHNERRDLEISDMSRSLKILAKELNVPVIALSQLNRKLEERADKRPLLSDLRESGALEQDADVVMFIYRDEVYNKDENNPDRGKAEVIIAKQRNGPVGIVKLAFLGAFTRFENLAEE